MADFMPKREAALRVWLGSLKMELPDHVATIEITPARLAVVNDLIDAHIAAMDNAEQKRVEWLAASALKKLQARKTLPGLRAEIARWKTVPGTAPAIHGMKLAATVPAVDATAHPPELAARLVGHQVKLRIKKRGVAAVDVYMKLEGDREARVVARVTRSPYVDVTPVRVPGQAETREYHLLAVQHDQPIGQPSSTVSITVPGTIFLG